MTGRNIFEIWAPPESQWTDWVRPVPFVAINDDCESNRTVNFTISSIFYLDKPATDTAIIIDLPGYDSIKEGVALAGLGFRPIPLYNGTSEQEGAMPLVDNHMLGSALSWGAVELQKINIASNAPPAFLLDSNRTHRYKMKVSVFDNSWNLYDQDIPTAEYFLNAGIKKILVRGDKMHKDLNRILHKFQKKGITILFTNGYDRPKVVVLKRPPRK